MLTRACSSGAERRQPRPFLRKNRYLAEKSPHHVPLPSHPVPPACRGGRRRGRTPRSGLRPRGAYDDRCPRPGDAGTALRSHRDGHQRSGHAARRDGKEPQRPLGGVCVRQDLPRLGDARGAVRRLPDLQPTLRSRRIFGIHRRRHGDRRAADRPGDRPRRAGRHGLPRRHDHLQRIGLPDAGRRPAGGAAAAAARGRGARQPHLCRRQGGPPHLCRRPQPLRAADRGGAHRPAGRRCPARAHLRGAESRGKTYGQRHGPQREGHGRGDAVETRRRAGRRALGLGGRKPRKGLLGTPRSAPRRGHAALPPQRTGELAGRSPELEGRERPGADRAVGPHHPCEEDVGGALARIPAGRHDVGLELRPLRPRPQQFGRALADRIFPDGRLHALRQREPLGIGIDGPELQLFKHDHAPAGAPHLRGTGGRQPRLQRGAAPARSSASTGRRP